MRKLDLLFFNLICYNGLYFWTFDYVVKSKIDIFNATFSMNSFLYPEESIGVFKGKTEFWIFF